MDAITEYITQIKNILDKVLVTQKGQLEKAAKILANAVLNGNNIFAFGCSHAGLLALELYYRSSGMALINPVRAPGLNLDVDPATMTSQIERLPEYGRLIIDNQPIKAGDVIIIHSVSGRNTVTVDAAIRSREIGAYVIALTSMEAAVLKSRHPSGKSLYQVADLVIDNCGVLGDGLLTIPGVPEKVGPASTAVGAAILNAVVAQAVALVAEAGEIPPVFVSGNLDTGGDHNKIMLEKYKDRIFYMGH